MSAHTTALASRGGGGENKKELLPPIEVDGKPMKNKAEPVHKTR